jgi:hypothetical protein
VWGGYIGSIINHYLLLPKVVVEWLTLLLHFLMSRVQISAQRPKLELFDYLKQTKAMSQICEKELASGILLNTDLHRLVTEHEISSPTPQKLH